LQPPIGAELQVVSQITAARTLSPPQRLRGVLVRGESTHLAKWISKTILQPCGATEGPAEERSQDFLLKKVVHLTGKNLNSQVKTLITATLP